jgi:hypothetical protein
MVALGLTGAYAESIPNLEVLTIVAFLSGVLLGVADGALVGAVTMLVYSALNPYGAAHPLLMASQVASQAVTGGVGGAFGGTRLGNGPWPLRSVVLALTGVALTLLYDLLTNLATGVLLGQIRATLIAGVPFAAWHLVTNLALFAVAGPALYGLCSRYRSRLA